MTRAPDQAFLEFVKSRAAPLHRMAYLLCGDWHLADDLVSPGTTARNDRRPRYEVPGEATGRPAFVAAASRRSS